MRTSLLLASLAFVLIPTALASYASFGSDSAVVVASNVWSAPGRSLVVDSLMPGLPFRVYSSQSDDIGYGDYTGNIVIRGSDGAQFTLVTLSRKTRNHVLSDENILYSPITITDLTKPNEGDRLIPFVIYLVNTKIPASPVISVQANQSEIYRIDSSLAKLSAPSCTVLNSAIRMELSEMDITPTGTIEIRSVGYDTIANEYMILAVNHVAVGSKLTIEGPIATLHNPAGSPANFTFTLEHNVDSDRELTPGAVTAILSQGWLSLAKAYDSDYPHDPAPFRRRYDFGGKLARLHFITHNTLRDALSCELWCEQGDLKVIGPYGCQDPQGTATIFIPAYCTAFNITIDPTYINDDPRFALQFQTVDATPATTTVAPTIADPYCNCAVDKAGTPDGWSYNDIWLDVVVIVDASEAMNDGALKSAGALVDSLISDGITDFLITDTKKKFSTRIGVIEMTDSARVLYNLNMTKADKIQGKISIKKGVKEINVIDAFNAATNMFNGAPISDRAYTRQVVFYITETNPNQNFASLNQFKQTKGVIIVNSQAQHSGLWNLASAGYYFQNSDNKQALGAFCKANCFCKPGKQAYGGNDQAITAGGGCYSSYPKGASFNNAESTCASEGGIIATDHDDKKGAFLNQVLSDASSKSDYFWIGFYRADDGVWTWDDESTDPYTNWEADEPNSAAVAKCAYVDSSTTALAWGAGNCNVAFPFVCEDVPCSVGYKNC